MGWIDRLLGRGADPERKRAEGLNRMAVKHIAAEQFVEAEELLLEAARLAPDTAAYHHNLGASYMGQKRYSLALKEMRKAHRLDPSDLETMVAIAKVLDHLGKREQSLGEYRKLCEEFPDDWRAHAALGNSLLERGQVEDALVHLERAAQMKPREELVHMVLAVAHEQRGDMARAIDAYLAVRRVSRTRQNRTFAEEKVRHLRSQLAQE